MSFHTALRKGASSVFLRIEEALDVPFGGTDNPLRHLGAIGLYLLWIVVGTGLYLYAVIDTSVTGAWSSIDRLSREQWYLGGVLRSVHRYAADAFIVVMGLHLLREALHGRYSGFRRFSWLTGVPLVLLAFTSAIGGYGGFFIPKAYGTSIGMTGSPLAALWAFLIFYVICLAVTWAVYTRRGGFLHDIERSRAPLAAVPAE